MMSNLKSESIKLTPIVTVERVIPIPDFPSASGIEVVHGCPVLVGDDTSTLLILNKDLSVRERVSLFESSASLVERIPKASKPDLEATLVADDSFIALGSGSKLGLRERGFVVSFKEGGVSELKEVNLSPLFSRVREILGSVDLKINIEGAAVTDTDVILFQRGGTRGLNYGIFFDRSPFLSWIMGESDTAVPSGTAVEYALPSINGVGAGFSGAAYLSSLGKIIFTASCEEGDDPILDGTVHGSFIGIISGDSRRKLESCAHFKDLPTNEKIESLAILEELGDQSVRALAVSDDDQGGSKLVELHLRF